MGIVSIFCLKVYSRFFNYFCNCVCYKIIIIERLKNDMIYNKRKC